MKKILSLFFLLACACTCLRVSAESTPSVYTAFDWFAVNFLTTGDGPLTDTTGVQKVGGVLSGAWTDYTGSGAEVQSHVLKFDPVDTSATHPAFVAVRPAVTNAFDGGLIEMTAKFTANESFPTLSNKARSALVIKQEEGSSCAFYGYTSAGWVRLSHAKIAAIGGATYTQRSLFRDVAGKLFVTYSIESSDGVFYELADSMGEVLLPCASSGPVKTVRFRGKTDLVDLFGTNLVSTARPTDVLPGGVPYLIGPWFDVQMRLAELGAALDETTGVRKIDSVFSGAWTNLYAKDAFTASVKKETEASASEQYLAVSVSAQSANQLVGPTFKARTGSSREYTHVEFTMRFFYGDDINVSSLPADTKAAMTMSESGSSVNFKGCVRDGACRKWVTLTAPGITAEFGRWYDLLAEFQKVSDGSLFVTYYVRSADGYVAFSDAAGNSRFPAGIDVTGTAEANRTVRHVDLLGNVDLKFLTGTDIGGDPSTVFYWVGGAANEWRNGSSWSHTPGGAACGAYPNSTSDAIAIVNDPATIVLTDGQANVSNLIVNADVVLQGAVVLTPISGGADLQGSTLNACGLYGSGRFFLDAAILNAAVPNAVWSQGTLAVEYSTTGAVRCVSGRLTFGSRLTGDGRLCVVTPNDGAGVDFAGDSSTFAGEIAMLDSPGNRAFDRVAKASGASARASWSFSAPAEESFTVLGEPGSYAFGMIQGKMRFDGVPPVSGYTMLVGGRNEDSVFETAGTAGFGAANADDNTLVKVGPASLLLKSWVPTLDVREGRAVLDWKAARGSRKLTFSSPGGTLALADGVTVDVSALLSDATAPIAFDDGGRNNIWNAQLPSSNKGGLVKKGAGDLYLTNAVPKYTGVTRVEAGRLIVKFGTALGEVDVKEGAALVVDLKGVRDSDKLVFSAASTTDGTRLEPTFINKPAGYELPTAHHGLNGGVIYSKDSHVFTWVGIADPEGLWSVSENWSVDGSTAHGLLPGSIDLVVVPSGTPRVTVDTKATVWQLECASDCEPFRFLSPLITDENYSTDTTASLTLLAGAPAAFDGKGALTTPAAITFAPGAGETNTFYGSVSAGSIVKSGAGAMLLAGENDFASLEIDEGELLLGGYQSVANLRTDFDASEPSTFGLDSVGQVRSWRSRAGEFTFEHDDGQIGVQTKMCFDGRNGLRLAASATDPFGRYLLSPSNNASETAAASLFVVYHGISYLPNAVLYGQQNGPDETSLKIEDSGSGLHWCNGRTLSDVGIFTGTNAVSGVIEPGRAYLTSWIGAPFSKAGETCETLGPAENTAGVNGVIGEIVSYARSMTMPERLVVQKSLLAKWGLDGVDYTVLPKRASVTMKRGTRLDLGSTSQTVASFSGAGTIANGEFRTTSGVITQTGGTLIVPAADGLTYNLAQNGARLVLTDGEGKVVTVVVPAGCLSGRVFCEGVVNWVKSDKNLEITDLGEGWYLIVNTVRGTLIRIR